MKLLYISCHKKEINMHPVISRLLVVKGFFLGGFVRDFLIRGEKFQDIDYSFHYPFALSDSDCSIFNGDELIRLDDSEEIILN